MKNFSKTIASLSLSVLALGAFGQAGFKVSAPNGNLHKMKDGGRAVMLHKGNTHASTQWSFLDYVFSDSTNSKTGTYMQYYVQTMNSRYDIADTGIPLSNQALLHSVAVAFDTLFDANTLTGTAANTVINMKVDSIFVLLGHENLSGSTDTIVIQINSVDVNGAPTGTILWADTIKTDTGLSPNHSWFYTYLYSAAPMLSLSGTTRFAVSMQYFGSKLDTLGFLYGFSSFTCASPSGTLADTTNYGANIGGMWANSFSTGWQYFASNHTTTYTFPDITYGEGVYYGCTSPGNGDLFWQDMAMFAEVEYQTNTGINNVVGNGLSVGQNYPNPFNKNTQISYTLTKSSDVNFTICDMTGRVIMSNNLNQVAPGQHVINLSANSFSPGVYFYTFNVNGSKVTNKMVITQ